MLLIVIFFSFRGFNLSCSTAWMEKLGTDELTEATDERNNTKKCLPFCEQQTNTPLITESIFPIKTIFHHSKYFCFALFKLARICQEPHRAKIFEESLEQNDVTCNEVLEANNTLNICTDKGKPILLSVKENKKVSDFLYRYAKDNFLILRVFIRDPYYTLIKQDEHIPQISFIGNVGGLLGLCMGLSFVSIFEIIYHLGNVLQGMINKM